MTRRLLDYDPLTGESVYVTYRDGILTLDQYQQQKNVSDILRVNQELQNDPEYSKRGMKEDWWHYAKIPNGVILKWRTEGVDFFNRDHKKKVFQKLNDPEYRKLKTTTKRHQGKG
jgi:hypothetical protein